MHTNAQSWLRSPGHLGLGLEAMTGRWRRDYSACLISAFLPRFVCTSEKGEEKEKSVRWRLIRYWKITNEKKQTEAGKQNRSNCFKPHISVDDPSVEQHQLSPRPMTADRRTDGKHVLFSCVT